MELVKYILSLACILSCAVLALRGDPRHCVLYTALCAAFSWLLVTDILLHFYSAGYQQYANLRPIVARALILAGLLYTVKTTVRRS